MPGMKPGPKRRVSLEPLDFSAEGLPSERFAAFCAEYLVVPKGIGVGTPMVLRPWQADLMAALMDGTPRPSIAGVMMPRGSGKTHLMASWMLFELYEGPQGNQLVCVAVDERQAHLVLDAAAAMVALNPELASRCQVFKDKLEVPGKGATFTALPAEAKRIEGLGNFSLAICDEVGVVARDTWETLLLGLGKVDGSTVVGIGTPAASTDSVLLDLRNYALEQGDSDPSFLWREFSAAGFEDHAVDCPHCWQLACPALGDFASEDAMRALLPPKTTEGAFRRARLCQFVSENVNPFIDPDTWDELAADEPIEEGADVVIALDGSHSQDATALVIATVEAVPHLDKLGLWERPPGDKAWRVDVLAVEQAIREACFRYNVLEVVADPFRWQRSLAVLASEGIPVTEFPHTPTRLTASTTAFHSAAYSGAFTHSGDEDLRRHMLAATVVDADGGLRIGKVSRRRRAERIDLAAASLMALSRSTWLANRRKKPARTIGFK